MPFRTGDRIEVFGYSDVWNGPGTVISAYSDQITVRKDNLSSSYGDTGTFPERYIRHLGTNPIGALAVGSRVQVSDGYNPSWAGEAVVRIVRDDTGGNHRNISVEMQTGARAGRQGSFQTEHLTVIEATPASTWPPRLGDHVRVNDHIFNPDWAGEGIVLTVGEATGRNWRINMTMGGRIGTTGRFRLVDLVPLTPTTSTTPTTTPSSEGGLVPITSLDSARGSRVRIGAHYAQIDADGGVTLDPSGAAIPDFLLTGALASGQIVPTSAPVPTGDQPVTTRLVTNFPIDQADLPVGTCVRSNRGRTYVRLTMDQTGWRRDDGEVVSLNSGRALRQPTHWTEVLLPEAVVETGPMLTAGPGVGRLVSQFPINSMTLPVGTFIRTHDDDSYVRQSMDVEGWRKHTGAMVALSRSKEGVLTKPEHWVEVRLPVPVAAEEVAVAAPVEVPDVDVPAPAPAPVSAASGPDPDAVAAEVSAIAEDSSDFAVWLASTSARLDDPVTIAMAEALGVTLPS